MHYIIKYAISFCSHIFFNINKQRICDFTDIYFQNFNETFTSDVYFEQLGPGQTQPFATSELPYLLSIQMFIDIANILEGVL